MTQYMKKMPIFVGGKDVGVKGVELFAIEEVLHLTK